MINASPSKLSSAARRNRKLAAAIEGLEPRAYLSGGGVTFGNPKSLSLGVSPLYVNLNPFYGVTENGRTVDDLITANSNDTVSILQNMGNGTFASANGSNTVSLDFQPLTIRAGVLTSNGLTDIVVGSSANSPTNSDKFAVITQNTSHVLSVQEYTTVMANTQSIAVGNFNGQEDVAVASFDPGMSNNVQIWTNDGNGNLSLSQTLTVPHANVASITTFTAGSTTDLAVADSTDSLVTTLINNGSGNFTIGQDYGIGSGNSDPITITDGQFNQTANSNDDLVTADYTSGTVSVLLGNGDGTFTGVKTTTVAGGSPLKVRMAYLNNDTVPDLICLLSGSSSGDAEVLLGNGDGTFHVGNIISGGAGPYTGIAAGDLNGDGLTDMVLANSSDVTSLLNTTSLDTGTPTAAIATSQVTTNSGASAIDFEVTYTDAQQVDTSTLSSNNLTVTTPSGGTETATLISTGLTPAASVTAEYSIPAQGNSASSADDGSYTVAANANSVMNAGGVAVAAGTIGTFAVTVTVPPPPPPPSANGPNLVAGAVTVNNPASAVAGTRFAGATRVTVVNSGNALAKGKIVIDLYASPDQSIPSGAQPLVSVTRNVNLKPGAKVVEALPGFKWPTTPGTDFIIADVDATQTIAETTFSDDIGISAKATNVAAPFVDIDNIWSGKLPKTLKVGRHTPLAVALENLGNVTARATATYTVQAEDANDTLTTIGSSTVRVVAAAGRKTAVSIPVTVPTTLASGTYHLLITISYPDDTNAADDTATSASTFSI